MAIHVLLRSACSSIDWTHSQQVRGCNSTYYCVQLLFPLSRCSSAASQALSAPHLDRFSRPPTSLRLALPSAPSTSDPLACILEHNSACRGTTMLKALHNHIFASKLRQVFDSSPLVLVYQSLGDLTATTVAHDLQQSIYKSLPRSGITPDVCRMRNSVAGQTGDPTMQQLFRASNMLVGFRTAPAAARPTEARAASTPPVAAAAAAAGAVTPLTASRRNKLSDLVGGLLQPADSMAASQQQQVRGLQVARCGDGALRTWAGCSSAWLLLEVVHAWRHVPALDLCDRTGSTSKGLAARIPCTAPATW